MAATMAASPRRRQVTVELIALLPTADPFPAHAPIERLAALRRTIDLAPGGPQPVTSASLRQHPKHSPIGRRGSLTPPIDASNGELICFY